MRVCRIAVNAADVDIIVVGAGIQGAGAAQAAAAAGYSVVLLEQTGIASGTSSRSSKLIHGGLRYLESGQLKLVRECLRERTLLLRNAPDLVRLTPHYLPVYRDTLRRPFMLRVGLSLYALLGGLRPDLRFDTVPRSEWATLDGVRQDGLQAVFRYFDAQTDDAALTRAVVRSAESLGMRLLMPATLLSAVANEHGVQVRYRDATGEQVLRCAALVNAAGPWVNALLERIEPRAQTLDIDWVAGTHIVLPQRLTQGVYYAEARDGRAVFIMPWLDGQTLVGTTERIYQGDPAAVAPTPAEVDYLLNTVHHYFPAYARLEPTEAFAGLRVLPRADNAAFGRSRDTRLHITHEQRVVSIYGGKLTAYRATAAKAVRLLQAVLPARVRRARTEDLRLG
ncbi:MAG: FAD-dependent oxidoreductase [Gammaproteobacteria bacterium]|nr:FAD-dependent oxidoreductase [Gammaproteobacteria bacterium]